MITRREIIQGLGGVIAAPAVIRVADLMPVKPLWVADPVRDVYTEITTGYTVTHKDLVQMTRKTLMPNLVVQLYNENPMFKSMIETQNMMKKNLLS